MTGLAHLRSVRIPRELFLESHDLLREIGAQEVEGLVLWAGILDEELFSVEVVLRPAQRAVRGEMGMYVLVDGPELHRVGVWLFRHRMQLIAQVHTHPTDAYHSSTDDAIPIVATEGGLSLVVPDFAAGPADIETYAAYRLSPTGEWLELAPRVRRSLLRVEDDERPQ